MRVRRSVSLADIGSKYIVPSALASPAKGPASAICSWPDVVEGVADPLVFLLRIVSEAVGRIDEHWSIPTGGVKRAVIKLVSEMIEQATNIFESLREYGRLVTLYLSIAPRLHDMYTKGARDMQLGILKPFMGQVDLLKDVVLERERQIAGLQLLLARERHWLQDGITDGMSSGICPPDYLTDLHLTASCLKLQHRLLVRRLTFLTYGSFTSVHPLAHSEALSVCRLACHSIQQAVKPLRSFATDRNWLSLTPRMGYNPTSFLTLQLPFGGEECEDVLTRIETILRRQSTTHS